MTRLMILHLWVLFIFQIRFSSIQANPNKVGCTLIGTNSNSNVMTKTTVMGATPNDVSNLISFSSNTYSSGGQQITVTIQNLQSGGAVIHSDKGSLTEPSNFDEKSCSGTNTLYHKQSGVSTSYTLTLTVPSDISNVNSITISVITAAGYGAISRQAKSLAKSGGSSPSPSSSGSSVSPSPSSQSSSGAPSPSSSGSSVSPSPSNQLSGGAPSPSPLSQSPGVTPSPSSVSLEDADMSMGSKIVSNPTLLFVSLLYAVSMLFG